MKFGITGSITGILLLMMLLPCAVTASTTGILAGFVTDREGEPVTGASVVIEGTPFGAMTDASGEYAIVAVDPGMYRLVARMVGYSTAVIEGVIVEPDQLSRIDFVIGEEAVGTTVISVEGSRSHVLQDVPSTIHMLDFSELRTRTLGSLADVMVAQPGVIAHGGEMHVRGGRSSEVDYLFDGVSIRSPMSNQMGLELPLSSISNAAMITGGLGVEYGNAMSGIVNIIGKEGGDELAGSVTYRGGDMTAASIDEGQQLYMEQTDISGCRGEYTGIELTASGPEPFTHNLLPALGIDTNGLVRFNAVGQIAISGRDTLDTRGRWENSWQSDISGTLKLTFRPLPEISASISLLGSYGERGWNEWDWSRYHLPAYIDTTAYMSRSQDYALPVRFNETHGLMFNITRLLGSESSLKLTLSSFKFQDWHRIRSEDGGYVGDGAFPAYWLSGYAPEPRVQDSSGFFHTGIHPNLWMDSKALVVSGRLEFETNPDTRVRLKAGISATYYDLYMYNVYALSFGNAYLSQWDAYPYSGAVYAQGSYRFPGGVITTAGLRADYFDANTEVFSPTEGEFVDVTPRWQVSPRFGFSVPFGERSLFFATYGQYFQMPSMNSLFLETAFNLAEERVVLGNPDLDAERTESIEVGIRYTIDRSTDISLAAYYKDITGLVSTEDHYEGLYYVFTNDDSHGMARGIETTLTRLAGSHLSGQLSYGLSISKGRYSSMLEKYNYSQIGVVYLSKEDNYLDWDQTHTFRISGELQSFDDEGPVVAGVYPFERSSVSLTWSYGSGLPYTLPPQSQELVETNTERYPASMQTDLMCSRSVAAGPIQLDLVLSVYNLFNRMNVVQIYDTALFHSTGAPGGEMDNPRAWSPARHLLLSAVLSW